MTPNDITSLVTSVGFPIAMCLLMYYTNNKTMKDITESLNNNTIVLEKILHWIDKGGKDDE